MKTPLKKKTPIMPRPKASIPNSKLRDKVEADKPKALTSIPFENKKKNTGKPFTPPLPTRKKKK